MVYFCYIDESGTPQIPGNTSHYVLAGLSIPISQWKKCETKISKIKQKYGLQDAETPTGWIVRKYLEQNRIIGFEEMEYSQRPHEVKKLRNIELLKDQNKPHYKQTKKNYLQTEPYINLSYEERLCFVRELADLVGSWAFSRLFAECIIKIHFDPTWTQQSVDEQALEQLVYRFEQFMKNVSKGSTNSKLFGTLIHDNNDTVARKHTALMKGFHHHGTLWTSIEHIIETPFFVNSKLTSLIQIADLCCYARRYFENDETDLLNSLCKKTPKYYVLMILSVLKIILNFEIVTYKCKLLIFKIFVSPISRADRSVSIVFEVFLSKTKKQLVFLQTLNRVQSRFDRKSGKIVGVRHFTDSSCQCMFYG